jgi:Mn2+/Fe2+ NRAMP family transporter
MDSITFGRKTYPRKTYRVVWAWLRILIALAVICLTGSMAALVVFNQQLLGALLALFSGAGYALIRSEISHGRGKAYCEGIARLSASVQSRHTQFSVAFITNIAESNFRYAQA